MVKQDASLNGGMAGIGAGKGRAKRCFGVERWGLKASGAADIDGNWDITYRLTRNVMAGYRQSGRLRRGVRMRVVVKLQIVERFG